MIRVKAVSVYTLFHIIDLINIFKSSLTLYLDITLKFTYNDRKITTR